MQDMRSVQRARRRQKVGVRALIALLCASGLMMVLRDNLEDVVLTMAKAHGSAAAMDCLNEAVRDIMREGMDYNDLMDVTVDDTGRVSMLRANSMRMNQLSMETALAAQARLNDSDALTLEIPLGAALGLSLLSNWGPAIQVRILPVGSVSAGFLTEFESAGINQTRHKIFLNMRATIQVVIPTGAGKLEAQSQVLVAESIIVGNVPQSFVDVSDASESLNFLP